MDADTQKQLLLPSESIMKRVNQFYEQIANLADGPSMYKTEKLSTDKHVFAIHVSLFEGMQFSSKDDLVDVVSRLREIDNNKDLSQYIGIKYVIETLEKRLDQGRIN